MTPTNLTSHVSVDHEHGTIVSFQIDDISGHIDFFFTHGIATQASAEKEHRSLIRSHEFVSSGSGTLSTPNAMGCLSDTSATTGLPFAMTKAMILCTYSSKKSMSLTVINCFAKG